MMKKIILSLVALLVFGNVFSQGINFEHSTFNEAMAKAKKENKVVFMDCYTTWCGPCKNLAKNIFTQKEVGDFFNKNFVNVKMDMESEEGKPLSKKYQVKAYPTLLWLDADGNIQHSIVGGCDGKGLIEAATLALDSQNNWSSLDEQFKAGERSPEFMQKYILKSSEANIDVKEAVHIYFSGKKSEDLINAMDAKIIVKAVKSTKSPIYSFVLKNKSKFYAVAEKREINHFLRQTMMGEMGAIAKGGDMEALNVKMEELSQLDELGVEVVAYAKMMMLRNDTDRVKFAQAVHAYAMKYEYDNAGNLSHYAGSLLRSKEAPAKETLLIALEMLKRSIELDVNCKSIDMYAFLLNVLGQNEDAIVQAKKAMELATEDEKEKIWSNKFLSGE